MSYNSSSLNHHYPLMEGHHVQTSNNELTLQFAVKNPFIIIVNHTFSLFTSEISNFDFLDSLDLNKYLLLIFQMLMVQFFSLHQ